MLPGLRPAVFRSLGKYSVYQISHLPQGKYVSTFTGREVASKDVSRTDLFYVTNPRQIPCLLVPIAASSLQ
jgi:hypothetical protein